MKVDEIKRAIDQLSDDERLELAAFLRWRNQKDDPEWQAELERRIDRCRSGGGRTSNEVATVHESLARQGK